MFIMHEGDQDEEVKNLNDEVIDFRNASFDRQFTSIEEMPVGFFESED